MTCLSFNNVGIAALTCAVPSFVQKIDPETSHDPAYVKSFIKQTGVTQRHISLTEQTSTDLGYGAALKAFEKAGWDRQSLDGLIFMSQRPDYNPGTGNAFILHKLLALPSDILAFDITLGCSSFPYGLSVCASFLQQKHINRLLMVSTDTVWPESNTKEEIIGQKAFLFGEGGTAILLEKREEAGPLLINLHTDGSGYHYIYNPFGGVRNAWRYVPRAILPNGIEYISNPGLNLPYLHYMDGLEVMSFSTTGVDFFYR